MVALGMALCDITFGIVPIIPTGRTVYFVVGGGTLCIWSLRYSSRLGMVVMIVMALRPFLMRPSQLENVSVFAAAEFDGVLMSLDENTPEKENKSSIFFCAVPWYTIELTTQAGWLSFTQRQPTP
jgi:hypothetical protein